MITDPRLCKHPLIHLVTNDTRYYCPDCGKYIYDYEPPKIIVGVDPVSGNDSMTISQIHPDGTIEHIKETTQDMDYIKSKLFASLGVPKKYLGSD